MRRCHIGLRGAPSLVCPLTSPQTTVPFCFSYFFFKKTLVFFFTYIKQRNLYKNFKDDLVQPNSHPLTSLTFIMCSNLINICILKSLYLQMYNISIELYQFVTVFQEFQDTGIFTQLCCVLLFSNLKLLIQHKSEWGA